jgi:hypothetical protein
MKTNYRKKKKELTTLRHYWLRLLNFNPLNDVIMSIIRTLDGRLKKLKDSK